MANEVEISELYANLSSESRCREADNSHIFREFIEANGLVGAHIFDHAILCRDRNSGRYTWHVMCDEYTLAEIRSPMARQHGLEPRIEGLRSGRSLECVEVVTRSGEHYFLNKI